jgi:hypothetical protein
MDSSDLKTLSVVCRRSQMLNVTLMKFVREHTMEEVFCQRDILGERHIRPSINEGDFEFLSIRNLVHFSGLLCIYLLKLPARCS